MLELTQGFAYAPEQREAIRRAVTENCLVLTGGPGTGKTTTVNAILNIPGKPGRGGGPLRPHRPGRQASE